MDKIKLIIVDSDLAICENAKLALNCDKIDVVGIANNGLQCIELLKTISADVILTELMLPTMDGYMLIEYINNSDMKHKPKIFTMTGMLSDAMLTAVLKKGIIYYFIKPLDYTIIKQVILEKYTDMPLWDKLNNKQPVVKGEATSKSKMQVLDEKISKIFIMIGIPAHIKGYQYLRYAIKQVMADTKLINNITKQLYPLVAKEFASSPSKVERAIRHAIDVAWSRGKIENINKVFGFKVYSPNDKPTNGEFVALVADKLMHDLSEDRY